MEATEKHVAAGMSNAEDYSGLKWIKSELDETIRQARTALEDYAEGGGDTALLGTCVERLHQTRGTLQMVQLYGAAMLAEEMEQVSQAMLDGEVRHEEEAAEALMLALVQLPDYLEKLQMGGRDIPIVILPLLNDLRATREAPLLSEASLFTPKLDHGVVPDYVTGAANADLAGIAHRLRLEFHKGLLAWYRDDDPNKSMVHIREVLTELKENAHTEPAYNLFWVGQALVEAVSDHSITAGSAVKLLFGKLDRTVKSIIDDGESGIAQSPDRDLLKNMLYYVARSDSDNPVVKSVQDVYRLDTALPSEQEVAAGRARLTAPSADALDTVRDVIKSDLTQIKDTLDLYVRGDHAQVATLLGLEAPLDKLADTLGMIGEGKLRVRLKQQVDWLKAIGEARETPDETELMTIASELLFVESSLANAGMVSRLGDSSANAMSDADAGALLLPQGELDRLVDSALHEADVDMARAKDAITAFLERPDDPGLLRDVPTRFRNIGGALRILSQPQPAEMLDVVGEYMQAEIIQRGQVPDREQLNALADVITSVEYYMETLREGHFNRDDILEIAHIALKRLGLAGDEATAVQETQTADTAIQGDVRFLHEPEGREDAEVSAAGIESSEALAPEPEMLIESPLSADKPALEDIDPEILEIFIEEANEELEVIGELYPRWKENREDEDAITTFRRSFHTLKGSGRLVGALTIGELAWSVENMLNRVIDKTIEVTPAVLGVLEETLEILPGLIEQQASGGAVVADVQGLMDKAFAAASPASAAAVSGEPATVISLQGEVLPESEAPALEEAGMDESVTQAPESEIAPEPGLEIEVPIAPAFEMDHELFEIFAAETRAHLESLTEFVSHRREHLHSEVDEDDVFRALHTLHGSANMADVAPLADASHALENLFRGFVDRGEQVEGAEVDLLGEGIGIIGDQLAAINQSGVELPNAEDFVARVDALHETRLSEIAALEQAGQEELSAAGADQETAREEAGETAAETAEYEQEMEPLVAQGADEVLATDIADAEAGQYIIVSGDEELIEIFLEEARELFDNLDAALNQWRQNPQDTAPVADLQRTLHTLKGGARLAGVAPMGDLAHALESLLTSVDNGQVEATHGVRELTQQVADRLSTQVDEIAVEKRVKPAADLVERLEAVLTRGPEVEAGEAQEAQSAPESGTDQAAGPVEEEAPAEKPPESDALVDVIAAAGRRREAAPARTPAQQLRETGTDLAPKREQVRVRSDVLDRLVNNSGEVSIYRARLEQQNSAIGFNLSELEQTVTRLRKQLRRLEMETETQILFRYERDKEEGATAEQDFDPLELDRFSTMQQVSRSLMETVNDLVNIKDFTEDLHREMDTLLMQQSRVATDLQDGLLRTRMVPFAQVVSRLQRLVRQTCSSVGKQADLTVQGAQVEVDRGILERMIAPLEHILRNAVSHGIEAPEERHEQSKDPRGRITLDMYREGTDVVLTVADDGRGLNLDSIRKRAIERGLLAEGADVADDDIIQFVLEPGFSTASEVTQVAGRGVGMDVVASEVKQLGGSLEIASQRGSGSSFTVRLPLTLAISEALLVQMEEDIYAVSHSTIEGIVRISRQELKDCYEGRQKGFDYAGHSYLVRYLGNMLGTGVISFTEGKKWFPMLLVRSGDRRVALQVDGLIGNRQIVVKSVGPQLSSVRWITGGTILGDGRVALILDVNSLVRMDAVHPVTPADTGTRIASAKENVKVMVVDDSITVRKVTGRLLERHNFQVLTAKDGVDAVALLQDQIPDVMLLDVEMPRMDGFELARHMQNSPDLLSIPIIMITSRTGEKHRKLALELGVKRYLGKPYQEMDLLDNIYSLLAEAQV